VRALGLLCLVVVLAFLGLMLAATEGHFVAPISDLYVVCQYAKAMAEGHPFRYNPGEAPTSGATSLLHTAVLAVAHRLGARGEGLVAFATLMGAALYVASVFVARRLGVRLGGPREGLLAAALVALGGPVVWAFLYGSDIAPFLFLALFLLERWLAWWGGAGAAGFAVAGALLALARPEGLAIALALGAAGYLRPADVRQRALTWAPAMTAFAALLLQRAVTGHWLSTSVQDKGLLPNFGLVESLAVATKYGVDVLRGLLLGFYPAEAPIGFAQGHAPFAFPPLGLVLVLLLAARPPAGLAAPLRTWLGVVAVVFALAGPNVFMGVHFNRYLLWAFPGLLSMAAAGLAVATRLVAREDERLERALFATAAGLALVLGALSTARFAAAYAQMAGETWRREIPAAEWIRNNLPPGVRIANVATSIEYLSGHRNVNLHGVTSPDFLGNRTLEREAGLFESLGRLEASERAPYLLVTRATLEGSALLPRLVEGAAVFSTASLGDDLLLFHARWDLVDRGSEPCLPETRAATAGLEEVDRLNVADSRDERNHAYRYASGTGGLVLGGSVGIDSCGRGEDAIEIADGGRPILGGERFRVRTHAGRDLVVVLRSHGSVEARGMRAQGPLLVPLEIREAGLVVAAAGRTLRFAFPNHAGWNEHLFRLPAEALSDGTSEIRIQGRYASFRYWFYQ
jgi:hypothetical protein